jgi:hypothetical protein
MGQSKKAILQLLLLLLVFASVGVWAGEMTWAWRIGLPLATLPIVLILYWANHREDKAPDILRELTGSFFERLGFCFAIIPTVEDETCVIQIFYQNRYSKPCTARVRLRHCTFLPKRQKNKLSEIAVEIHCSGAECGMMRVPWAISKEYQGKLQNFDVGADVKYPDRRGMLLRFREGLQVGSTAFPAGVAQTPARCELALPSSVVETISPDSKYIVNSIWRAEDGEDVQTPKSEL